MSKFKHWGDNTFQELQVELQQKKQGEEEEFTAVFIRHCQSCANIMKKVNKIFAVGEKGRKAIWRPPLCTPEGISQCIRAGLILGPILESLGLSLNVPFFSSLLPRAFTTAAFTSWSFDKENNLTDTEPIRRVAYIKEKTNTWEKLKKKMVGQFQQSANTSDTESSNIYVDAVNNLFQTYKVPVRNISKSPKFLEDIIREPDGKVNYTKYNISNYDAFERDVLPKIIKWCKQNGFTSAVFFVHGHWLQDAFNRPGVDTKLNKKFEPWVAGSRNNLSMHRIKYRHSNGENIRVVQRSTNLQLDVLDKNGEPILFKYNSEFKKAKTQMGNKKLNKRKNAELKRLVQASVSPRVREFLKDSKITDDPMNNCKYKHHREISARSKAQKNVRDPEVSSKTNDGFTRQTPVLTVPEDEDDEVVQSDYKAKIPIKKTQIQSDYKAAKTRKQLRKERIHNILVQRQRVTKTAVGGRKRRKTRRKKRRRKAKKTHRKKYKKHRRTKRR